KRIYTYAGIRRIKDVPRTVAVNTDVGFPVAIKITRNRRIACLTPTDHVYSIVEATQDVPDATAEDSDVRFSVSIIIGVDRRVRGVTPLGNERTCTRPICVPGPVTVNRSIGFAIPVKIEFSIVRYDAGRNGEIGI